MGTPLTSYLQLSRYLYDAVTNRNDPLRWHENCFILQYPGESLSR